jgi:beta-galactosidase/beta-glucuronidase
MGIKNMSRIYNSLLLFQSILILTANAQNINSATPKETWDFRYLGSDSVYSFTKIQADLVHDSIVSIPHTFNLNERLGEHRSGFACYTRLIEIPKTMADRQPFFVCEGVALRCKVFIDSLFVGEYRHPWIPFSMDITPYITKGGKHLISIVVDNRLLERDIPDKKCDGWWVYGGMIRNAYIDYRGKDRIDNVTLQTLYVSKDTFDLVVDFETAGSVDSVVLSVMEPKPGRLLIRKAIISNDANQRKIRIGQIHAWTPDDPFRYEFSIVPYLNGKKLAPTTIKRGFAQLTTQSNNILLNGKHIYLSGIARHDVIGTKGPLLSRKERFKDLLDIKELGANFMRIAHFPQDNDVYELADSLGIIIMDEIPAWKTAAEFLSSDPGKALASGYIEQVIKHHGNYTCIGLWSIGNEFNTLRSDVAGYVQFMSLRIKELDPSRLVTYCSYFYQFDKAYGFVDVISINEYFGWYLGSIALLTPMLEKIHSEWPEKPMIIAEFGAQAALGLRNPAAKLAGTLKSPFNKDLSEDHQALYLQSHIDTIWKRNDICKGITVWLYNDFNAPREKPHTIEMPLGLNGMGIVDINRNRKKAFDVVKSRYHEMQKSFGK